MNVSQTSALTEAQAQPSASSRPNMARRRGTVSRLGGLVGPSSSASPVLAPSGCPVMFACTEHAKGYVPAARAGTSKRALGHAREDVGLEHLGAGAVLDLDVVRDRRRPGCRSAIVKAVPAGTRHGRAW